MNRKSNPRELKMKEDLELLSKAVIKQHDVITVLTKENELLTSDKKELLTRLEHRNREIENLKKELNKYENDIIQLRRFKSVADEMIRAYLDSL